MQKQIPSVVRQKTKYGVYLFSIVTLPSGERKRVYFGKEADPGTQSKILEFRRQFLAGRYSREDDHRELSEVSIAFLATKFLTWARNEYSPRSQEPERYRYILKMLVLYCGEDTVESFGLATLEAFRQTLIDNGSCCRKEINQRMQRLKRVFKWGAARRLVPLHVNAEIQLLEALRKGRGKARENPPVRPVPLETVARTMPHLSSVVAAMVRLQLLTGARPGEVRIMRPCDIDRTVRNGCWRYTPEHDKTERFRQEGEQKIIPLNAEAQRIIMVHSMDLSERSTQYIFRPTEAMREIRAERARNRTTKLTKSQIARDAARQKKEKLGELYSASAYRIAIRRAAAAAGVPAWTPYQLRHTAATEIRKKFGLEAAQTLLGHKSLATTQIYAEPDMEKAEKLAEKIEGFLG